MARVIPVIWISIITMDKDMDNNYWIITIMDNDYFYINNLVTMADISSRI